MPEPSRAIIRRQNDSVRKISINTAGVVKQSLPGRLQRSKRHKRSIPQSLRSKNEQRERRKLKRPTPISLPSKYQILPDRMAKT